MWTGCPGVRLSDKSVGAERRSECRCFAVRGCRELLFEFGGCMTYGMFMRTTMLTKAQRVGLSERLRFDREHTWILMLRDLTRVCH